MYSRKIIFAFTCLLLLSLFTFASPTVYAGNRGQQLNLYVSCEFAPALGEVRVDGYNQDHLHRMWPANQPAVVNARSVTTWNYWWIGQVQVDYRFAGINPYTGFQFPFYRTWVNVPEQFNVNVFSAAVDKGLNCIGYQAP